MALCTCFCLHRWAQLSGVTGHPLAAFTGLAKQLYRAGEDIEEGGRKKGRRQKKKEKREKKGKLKEGNHRACAKAGPEHATVTMVRLGTHYSDYGALGNTLQ